MTKKNDPVSMTSMTHSTSAAPAPFFVVPTFTASTTAAPITYVCSCCENPIRDPGAYIWLGSPTGRIDFCSACTPYLKVVLPMTKAVREKTEKGEL